MIFNCLTQNQDTMSKPCNHLKPSNSFKINMKYLLPPAVEMAWALSLQKTNERCMLCPQTI